MTIEKLIEKLQKCDKNAIVIVSSSNFELKGAVIELSQIHKSNKGNKRSETFRDAFDYGLYSHTTFSTFGGKLKVVALS